jgi:hypothetical protein
MPDGAKAFSDSQRVGTDEQETGAICLERIGAVYEPKVDSRIPGRENLADGDAPVFRYRIGR